MQKGCPVHIMNVCGGNPKTVVLQELFTRSLPDVIAFSVTGRNLLSFTALAEPFEQIDKHHELTAAQAQQAQLYQAHARGCR